MYSGHGIGRGHDHDSGGGCGSFGSGRSFTGGRYSTPDKGPRHCKHCGQSNHISEKCWEKFGRPEWAQLADSNPPAPSDTPHVPSSAHHDFSGSFIVILSEEYARLRQLKFPQNSHLATHASSSGMHAYNASSQKPRILDSGASSHMTGIKQKFVH